MINLASTEARPDVTAARVRHRRRFRGGTGRGTTRTLNPGRAVRLRRDRQEGVPYGNFTPSVAVDVPALMELAERQRRARGGQGWQNGADVCEDGNCPRAPRSCAPRGRLVLAQHPGQPRRARAPRQATRFRLNSAPKARCSTVCSATRLKIMWSQSSITVRAATTKKRGTRSIWKDFLGQKMQLKLNFLCKDSILAAPLVIEIARALDLARRRGDKAACKNSSASSSSSPVRAPWVPSPEHAFPDQQRRVWSPGLRTALPANTDGVEHGSREHEWHKRQ